MIPRKLIRFHTLPSWTFELPEEPMIGLYFNFHSFEKAETAEIALVRFVVPVVPEAAITLHPIDWVLAMEVPPVPASGIFFSAAAFKASLFAFGIAAHQHDAINFILTYEPGQLFIIFP